MGWGQGELKLSHGVVGWSGGGILTFKGKQIFAIYFYIPTQTLEHSRRGAAIDSRITFPDFRT